MSERIGETMHRLFCVCLFLVCCAASASKLQFWDSPRAGTNFFNEVETRERFVQAKAVGIQVVRLTFNKWATHRPGAAEGDFLLGGKTQDFSELFEPDFAKLLEVLNWADDAGIKVVLTHLSLPGLRWVQQNGNVPDLRLWQDFKFHAQSAAYWKQLAARLKSHPAIVGYNLLNEPHPERLKPRFADWYTGDYAAWYNSVQGSPRDLNLLHRTLAAAIREVDADTPLILDSGFYATPWAFKILEPLADSRVLYSFHMYEPYAFTSFENKGKFSYPGAIPIGQAEPATTTQWEAAALQRFLDPVRRWQKRWGVPASRVFVSEFGTFRTNKGASAYLRDLTAIWKHEGWHWAFYSFREDSWAGMDYELGDHPREPGQLYPLTRRIKHYCANELWQVLLDALQPSP